MKLPLVCVVMVAACGDGGEPLTCEWIASEANCWNTAMREMYACVGLTVREQGGSLPDVKYYVEGTFSADGVACVDTASGGAKKVTFAPPFNLEDLGASLYRGGFSMWNGNTLCGTVDLTDGRHFIVEVPSGLRGEVILPTDGEAGRYICRDETRVIPKPFACYSSIPSLTGGVFSQRTVHLGVEPTDGLTFSCTKP